MKKIKILFISSVYLMTLLFSLNLSAKECKKKHDCRLELMHEIIEDLSYRISVEMICISEFEKDARENINQNYDSTIDNHKGRLNAYIDLYNDWSKFLEY